MEQNNRFKNLRLTNNHLKNGSFNSDPNTIRTDSEGISSRINESRKNNLNSNKKPVEDKTPTTDASVKPDDVLSSKDNSVKTNAKASPKDTFKKMGAGLAAGALNKGAKSDDDLTRAASKTTKAGISFVQTIKKLVAFFSTPFGWIILVILGILFLTFVLIAAIVATNPIITALPTKYSTVSDTFYDEFNTTYEDEDIKDGYQIGMKRGEIDKIDDVYTKNGSECKGASFVARLFGIYDLSEPGDFCLYFRRKLSNYESKPGISVYPPGYIISVLNYAFSTQGYDIDGNYSVEPKTYEKEDEDEVFSFNELNLILGLFEKQEKLNNKAVYKNADVNDLMDSYVLHHFYTYYKYECVPTSNSTSDSTDDETEDSETESSEEETEPTCEPTCVEYTVNRYEISEFKLKLFLRYGKYVSDKYEEDMNNNDAIANTDPECQDMLKTTQVVDLNKYTVKANPNLTMDDRAKIEIDGVIYGYDSGFIFKTYPKYKLELRKLDELGYEKTPYNYRIDKKIEETITDISTRKEYFNYVLGYQSKFDNYDPIGKTNNNGSNNSENCTYDLNGIDVKNIKVRLLYDTIGYNHTFTKNAAEYDGKPIEGEKDIPFEDWVYGVVYHEIGTVYYGDDYGELWKAQAIMARSFGLSRPSHYNAHGVSLKEENGQWILSLRNGVNDAAYCNPETGCYICPGLGYGDVTFSGDNPIVVNNMDKCQLWVAPEEGRGNMKKYTDEVTGVLLYDSSGNVALAGWPDMNDYNNRLVPAAKSGMDYSELLQMFYYGQYTLSRSNCNTNQQNGTLDSTEKDSYMAEVLRQYPDLSEERKQAITTALNSVGLPYFWGGGHGSLSNLIDIATNKWGKEYCTITAGGLASQPAGSQQLCGLDCTGFVRWVMYSATGADPGAGVSGVNYTIVGEGELLPGDVGYISAADNGGFTGHVGIYLYTKNGSKVYIHASNGVQIGSPSFTTNYKYNYMN